MQKNVQPPIRFLADMGHLLADRADHVPPPSQRQALANLADYLRAARQHHQLTWTTLAQQTGRSEAEMYALEQGLFPYTQLDFPLLCRLATALGEEVETLTLLMGSSAPSLLPHAMPAINDPKPVQNKTSSRTNSQHLDNWLATLPAANPLHKRYLNLVDSWQGGRLFSYTQANYGVSNCAKATLSLLACLLLLWVSTYSFSAQLTTQSDTRWSSQPAVLHQNAAPGPSSRTLRVIPSVDQMAVTNTPQPSRQIAKAAVYPPIEEQITPVAGVLSPMSVDLQQCDVRTIGRFTLCRV